MKWVWLTLLWIIFDCSNNHLMVNQSKTHHTKSGFQNIDSNVEHGLIDFLKWQYDRIAQDIPKQDPANYSFPILENDGSLLRENTNKFSATWVGHATTLIQIDGKNILTDPIWSERCSPVSFIGPKRYTKPSIQLDDLPKIHIVLISHNHYDHLDLPTLKELDKKFHPIFMIGLNSKHILSKEGIENIVELDWWDEVYREGLKIHFTPTQHFSARSITDRNESLWGSFVVTGSSKKFYFAGDTGYFSGFKEIGKRFPDIDLAILPIGAYEPRWFMKVVHFNPDDASKAFLDLNAKMMLPIHYQTFILTDEPLDEPLKLIKKIFTEKQIPMEKLVDLKIGESRFLD